MRIDISEIKVKYENGTLELGILNKNGLDYNKTLIGVVQNIKDFDRQILNFLHSFISQD